MSKSNEKSEAPEQPGLVISYFGSSVAVETESGQVFQCHLRRNQELPVVGDRVKWHMEDAETGVVSSILPRRTQLSRGEGHGKSKAIAANVDVILIVMSPVPVFSEYLIDRYLVAAELVNIQPILVLNKSDLLDEKNREAAVVRLKPYSQIPYLVILSSALTKDGLVELASQLKDKTGVLVGPSGVGKSSIISALGYTDPIRVGNVSAKGAGRHTTTATRLYHLPQGGSLIDSPGVREFNLWSVTKEDVLRGFKEFQGYTGKCKFRDCRHLVEPGCVVQEAVANGKISPTRYANFQELVKEAGAQQKY